MTSVPVMSDGIRSGVNWMRLNVSASVSASVRISSVLASPGTPTSRQCPRANMRDQQLLDHALLADDHLAQLAGDLLIGLVQPPNGLHVVFVKHDWSFISCRYRRLVVKSGCVTASGGFRLRFRNPS